MNTKFYHNSHTFEWNVVIKVFVIQSISKFIKNLNNQIVLKNMFIISFK